MNETFSKENFEYPSIYRGEVLSNTDPDKLGRLKVRVFGIFSSEIATDKLPWAVPAYPIFTGSGVGYGSFAVPEVGSHVFVFFEMGDVYQPVYFLEAPDAVHNLSLPERTTSYPYRKIHKTKNGVTIYVDDLTKVVRLTHPSTKYLEMDGSGNITIVGAQVTITGDRIDLNP